LQVWLVTEESENAKDVTLIAMAFDVYIFDKTSVK